MASRRFAVQPESLQWRREGHDSRWSAPPPDLSQVDFWSAPRRPWHDPCRLSRVLTYVQVRDVSSSGVPDLAAGVRPGHQPKLTTRGINLGAEIGSPARIDGRAPSTTRRPFSLAASPRG